MKLIDVDSKATLEDFLTLKKRLNLSLLIMIMTAYVMFEEKKPKKTDRIVNIDKEKYEINSLHVYSCYDITGKEIFVVRLSKNQYKSTVYTHNSYNM